MALNNLILNFRRLNNLIKLFLINGLQSNNNLVIIFGKFKLSKILYGSMIRKVFFFISFIYLIKIKKLCRFPLFLRRQRQLWQNLHRNQENSWGILSFEPNCFRFELNYLNILRRIYKNIKTNLVYKNRIKRYKKNDKKKKDFCERASFKASRCI